MAKIVNDGVEWIRDQVRDEFNYCQIGTSDTAVDYTDDSLISYEAEETVTVTSDPSASDGSATLEVEAEFTGIEATIDESGLFNDEQVASPTMLARGVLDESATLSEDDILEITWTKTTSDSEAP